MSKLFLPKLRESLEKFVLIIVFIGAFLGLIAWVYYGYHRSQIASTDKKTAIIKRANSDANSEVQLDKMPDNYSYTNGRIQDCLLSDNKGTYSIYSEGSSEGDKQNRFVVFDSLHQPYKAQIFVEDDNAVSYTVVNYAPLCNSCDITAPLIVTMNYKKGTCLVKDRASAKYYDGKINNRNNN